MTGKTIRLYLADGLPTGILTAEIINWTGKMIVGPRTQLAELAAREEARSTGVYLLIGPDPESTTRATFTTNCSRSRRSKRFLYPHGDHHQQGRKPHQVACEVS